MGRDLTQKIKEISDQLPIIIPFLIYTSTEKEQSTRFEYAEELKLFFLYLQQTHQHFQNLLLKRIEISDLSIITPDDVSGYLAHCFDMGLKERTIARKRASLASFFRYLTDTKKMDFNPILAASRVKIHQSDQVIHLTLEEQIQFIDSIFTGADLDSNKQKYHEKYAYRDRAIVIMLLDTGLRNSELRNINIRDLDLDDCSVLVQRKGGSFETIYFADVTRDAICDYLNDRKATGYEPNEDFPLFITLKGERISASALQKLIKKYALSSLPGKGQLITPHKMRSSSAMGFYSETRDILALQKKLGHKTIQATNIYAKATEQQMREQRNVIGNKWKSLKKET